jgi:hypothetical protein
MDSQRRFVISLLAASSLLRAIPASAAPDADQPRRTLFEDGDFLWPKPEGAFIPYAGTSNNRFADAQAWTDAKNEYVRVLEASSNLSGVDRERLSDLKKMNYEQFRAVYADGKEPNSISPRGGGFYVGHVAILEKEGNDFYVIEALMGRGVIRHSYDEWINDRKDQLVWLGRLDKFSAADRAKVPKVARQFVGAPYKFWNFDLNDTSGFYCSKLVWHAVVSALNTAPDGNDDAKRKLWLSPKKLLKQKSILKISSPGRYATA